MRIKEIKDLLGKGKTKEPIEEIVTLTETQSSEYLNAAVLLQGRFNECEQKRIEGINVDSEIAQIKLDAIELLDLIDKAEKGGASITSQESMDFQKTIDLIVSQERKEIKKYSRLRFAILIGVILFLCYNLISKNISLDLKSIPIVLVNFLPLFALLIPIIQIGKRQKTIIYFDKIIRIGISGKGPDKEEYVGMVMKFIRNALIV